MAERLQWVLLAYRLPREPSTPRIALWRRLRRLGAIRLVDNLVALPYDGRSKEQFDWLADEVGEAGGEATVWLAEAATRSQERALVARAKEALAADYGTVTEAAQAARTEDPAARRRALARLRRALHAIRSRDYFSPPERDGAERAVEELARAVEVGA